MKVSSKVSESFEVRMGLRQGCEITRWYTNINIRPPKKGALINNFIGFKIILNY